MATSIGGLASGLDTSSIVESLMAGERQARARILSRQTEQNRAAQVWQDISSKLSSLKTAAEAFTSPTQSAATNVSSSDDKLVGVSAGSGAAAGTFSFRVKQLAVAHQSMATGFSSTTQLVGTGKAFVSAGTDFVGLGNMTSGASLAAGRYEVEVKSIAGGNATVVFGGKTQTVSTTGAITLDDGKGNSATFNASAMQVGKATIGVVDTDAATTLARLATSINNLNIGATAAAVDLGDGTANPVNFVVSARDVGTRNAVKVDVSGLAGMASASFSDLRAAADAQLVLADGVTTVTRSSNKVSDLLTGVTLDLKSADPAKDVTVTVGRDNEKTGQSVKAVVDAMNSLLTTINRNTAYNPETRSGGPLVGDSRTRRLTDQLRTAFQHQDGTQSLKVLSQIGITLTSSGTYSFDQAKLTKALADDFSGTMRLLSGDGAGVKGALNKVVDAAKALTQPNGLVAGAIDTAQARARSLGDDVERYDERLVMVEQRFRRQYTRLEQTLSQLSGQMSSLTRAIG